MNVLLQHLTAGTQQLIEAKRDRDDEEKKKKIKNEENGMRIIRRKSKSLQKRGLKKRMN